MAYVMVPVPEQHVLEVMRYVTGLAGRDEREPARSWDDEGVHRLFSELGDSPRAVLEVLAEGAGRTFRPKELAERLGLEASDIAGIIGPLNRQVRRQNRLPLIESRPVAVEGPNGRSVKRRGLTMSEEVADMIRAAAAAERVGSESNGGRRR